MTSKSDLNNLLENIELIRSNLATSPWCGVGRSDLQLDPATFSICLIKLETFEFIENRDLQLGTTNCHVHIFLRADTGENSHYKSLTTGRDR